MSKKLLLIMVVSLIMVVALFSCGQQPSTESPQTPSPSPTPSPVPTTSMQLTMLSISEGEVLVMKAGTANWVEGTAGTALESGDSIKAGSNSRAIITFFDGSTIELEAGTEISIAELYIAASGSTTISLKQELGKTVSRVQKLTDSASRYDVETPAAVAIVRGSTMGVYVDEQGNTVVSNLEGDIRVFAGRQEFQVPAGREASIKPGHAPELVAVPSTPTVVDSGDDEGDEGIRVAAVDVTKEANTTQVHEGNEVVYTYYVTNPGEMVLSNVSVNDDKAGNAIYQSGDANGDGKLDMGETWMFTVGYEVSEQDDSPLVNVAIASGKLGRGQTVTAQDSASVVILRPGIAVAKAADPTQVHDGDIITYTYDVTNTGNTSLSNISVSDNKAGDAVYKSGDTNGDNKLDIGETWIFIASYTASGADASPLVNTATASGTDDLSRQVTAQANASVVILRPGIAIAKAADPTQVHDGDIITYTYDVTNTGNTSLSDISVSDNKAGDAIYQSGDTDGDNKLDIGETWIFIASYTASGADDSPLLNTATASGTDALSRQVTAQANASVTLLRPGIDISKEANPTVVYEGDEVIYTYEVTNTGNTPLSDISVSDDKAGDAVYQSGDTDGDNKLDIGETWIFTTSYTVSGDDPTPLVNVATASGTDALAQMVIDQDSAIITVLELTVEITNPEDGATITYRTISVNGTVNDPSITEAIVTINGDSHTISVSNGEFGTSENVAKGQNIITVTVNKAPGISASDTVTINVDIPIYGIRVELTWDNTATDLDAHLIRPGAAMWNIPGDCHWNNAKPDWGIPGDTEDNPSLDQDDRDGYGPENITLEKPDEQGSYQFNVHYWNDYGHGNSLATVIIWVNDIKIFEDSREMSNGEVWNCASIEWPSGLVT